jgi:hypothetical protein
VKRTVRTWLTYAAIAGDVVFVLWVLRNGLEQGFRGTPVEMASSAGLIALLVLNAVLLTRS